MDNPYYKVNFNGVIGGNREVVSSCKPAKHQCYNVNSLMICMTIQTLLKI